jgi:RNA polymerase sigma-70 factor, ECF subfamily
LFIFLTQLFHKKKRLLKNTLENEDKLIKACLRGEPQAFDALYRRFASKMLVVCNRYARSEVEAEDLLQEGFIKIFEKLHTYKSEGSFEGWVRRIMVNTAIEHYRRDVAKQQYNSFSVSELHEGEQPFSAEDIVSQITFDDLLQMVQNLSPAYKMVFNLYVFEGFKHHEIAEKLSISEGTSKSNLADARKILQKKVMETMFLDKPKRL